MTNVQVTKQAVREEYWHRGNLSYKLHSAQKQLSQAFNSIKTPLFVGNCSRQNGKSFWAVTKAIETALRIKNAQIRYGAAFQSDLVDFIIPAFEKVMEDAPKALKGKYKVQGSKFVFPNGSTIKLVGLDKNPNGLRGNTLDLIIIDECGFVSNLDYVYKSVIIPATTHRPNAKIVLISTPPSTPAHPFLDYVQKAEAEGGYKMFTIFDNPMLDDATVLRLMKETGCKIPESDNALSVIATIRKSNVIEFPDDWVLSTTFRREYLCEFITDSDLQIIPEWQDKFAQDYPKDEYRVFYHNYVGMDLGTKDFTACIFGYYDFRKATLVIEDEFKMNGPQMNTQLLVGEIKAKEAQLWGEQPVFRRVSDNNNLHLLQDMSSLHNLHFIATNKDTLEAMINEVRLMVQAGRIVINPKCKQLIGCMKYGVWDEKRKGFARSTTYGHFDALAALIYLVRNLALNSNPIPKDHGFQNHKAWLGNIKDQIGTTDNGNTMKKAILSGLKKPKIPS
jgi:hypothetical protein